MRVRDPATGRFVKMVPATTLTAAATSIPTRDIDNMPRMASGLQERAWRLWRILGVLQFPTGFKARQVSRLDWNVTVNGELLEPEDAKRATDSITAPFGQAQVTESLALNFIVAGQVFYARIANEWKVYAATTPRLKDRLKKADIIVEGMTPDPEKPEDAWSSVFATLGTAEQIRLMAAMSRGQDRNRLAQRGILLIPKEGQFPDDDPFMPILEQAMTAPIADEYAASAVVPPVVTYPAEYIDKWKHLVLESSYDDKLMDRIEATIRQFALELDLPPEMLLGNMDSNHWNAWLSSEENIKAYTIPLGTLVGEVLARAMMDAVDGAVQITVTPDPAAMLVRSATVEDAFRALEMLVVGYDYVRRIIGADEDDAPTPDEIELILRAKGLGAPAELPEADAQEPPDMPANGNGSPNGTPVTAAISKNEEALDRLSRQLQAIDIQLLGHLKGAATMAIEHARDKLRADIAEGLSPNNDDIASELRALGIEWERQIKAAHRSLKDLGIDTKGPEWQLAADTSVEQLVDGMTAFISDSLDKTDSEVPAVPTLLLRQVLATAGGSATATVAAVTANPAPTFQDPQGFAVGVLSLKDLKKSNIVLTQWRFRYGPLTRTDPFQPHKDVDGQFMTSEGLTSEGYHPGDHKGCECFSDPILRVIKDTEPV